MRNENKQCMLSLDKKFPTTSARANVCSYFPFCPLAVSAGKTQQYLVIASISYLKRRPSFAFFWTFAHIYKSLRNPFIDLQCRLSVKPWISRPNGLTFSLLFPKSEKTPRAHVINQFQFLITFFTRVSIFLRRLRPVNPVFSWARVKMSL